MKLAWLWLFILAAAIALNAVDLKVTKVIHYSKALGNHTDQSIPPINREWKRTETTYIHGPMRRFEYEDDETNAAYTSGGLRHAAHIENCDTRESMIVDLDSHQYKSMTYPSDEVMRSRAAQRQANQAKEFSQLKMLAQSNTVDTGEITRMFGYAAHHLITTTHQRPQGEVQLLIKRREEGSTDGWYLDANIQIPMRGCEPKDLVDSTLQTKRSELLDERDSGPSPHGFPVKTKSVRHTFTESPMGGYMEIIETMETTVTELSETPVDMNLFAIPPGFKRVTCFHGQPCDGK